MLGWGKVKETDTDGLVKVSRNAMFNYRIKFKGIKFPSPDPTVPAKDFILKMTVWSTQLLGGEDAVAEGLLPLQPLFLDCMQVYHSHLSAADAVLSRTRVESIVFCTFARAICMHVLLTWWSILQRNLGKASPDDMEIVTLEPDSSCPFSPNTYAPLCVLLCCLKIVVLGGHTMGLPFSLGSFK